MTTNTREIDVKVGEFTVGIETGETADGEVFITLLGLNCNLEGDEPGTYFPTALKEDA